MTCEQQTDGRRVVSLFTPDASTLSQYDPSTPELSLYLLLMSLPLAKLTPLQSQMSQLTEKRVLVPYNKSSFR